MKSSLIDQVYEFVNHLVHGSGNLPAHISGHKYCPVTGLDISMQPYNSKFISFIGVKWYFEHKRRIYDTILAPRLTSHFRDAEPELQFREIAHNIRNADSNPRNNSRRAIRRLLTESGNTLFDNTEYIDRRWLEKAGMTSKT
jgi:hypothetical protein